jgi:HK97 family phage major capsid protein
MANTTSSAATLTKDQVEALLILPLQQASTYMAQGFPVFVSNGEPIKVPSLTAMGTPGYVAEGAQIPEVSASTSEISLLPSTVQSVKIIPRVSRELMRQSIINVDNAFSTKMVSDVARVLDEALWNGAGTAGAPRGIAQFTGVTSAGTAGGTVTADKLYDMQELAFDASVDFTRARWAMSPKNLTRVRKLADSTGQKFLTPGLASGAPST